MLYHPYIMELLVKEMQRELLAEANRTHQIRAVQTGRSLTVKLTGNMLLFLANMLIESGTRLKKFWMSWQLDQASVNGDTGSL